MGSQVSGDGVQETAGLRNRGTRKQERTEIADQDTAGHCKDLTTGDSVTGSDIAPEMTLSWSESASIRHPPTDTCSHIRTHITERGWDREPMNRDINKVQCVVSPSCKVHMLVELW